RRAAAAPPGTWRPRGPRGRAPRTARRARARNAFRRRRRRLLGGGSLGGRGRLALSRRHEADPLPRAPLPSRAARKPPRGPPPPPQPMPAQVPSGASFAPATGGSSSGGGIPLLLPPLFLGAQVSTGHTAPRARR